MTAPLIETVDLAEYDFRVTCEYGRCGEPATVGCKGCADKFHRFLCAHHLGVVRERFDSNIGKQCANCQRPWWEFDTHYDVQGIV